MEIKGEIRSLQGACPTVGFSIDDTAVQATGDTRYDDGSCGSLRNGTKVEVKGIQSSNPRTMIALEIKVKDKGDDDGGDR